MMNCTPDFSVISGRPLAMIATTRPPVTASMILPRPPNSEVPPITAAPTAYSSVCAPPVVGDTELSRLAIRMPATIASVEQRMKHVVLMFGTLMPRAAQPRRCRRPRRRGARSRCA